jgi:hypothetical protein
MVELYLAKIEVAGSSPVGRSSCCEEMVRMERDEVEEWILGEDLHVTDPAYLTASGLVIGGKNVRIVLNGHRVTFDRLIGKAVWEGLVVHPPLIWSSTQVARGRSAKSVDAGPNPACSSGFRKNQ